MSALAVTFPPSKNFELYLRKFLSDHVESEDLKTAVFAKHCLTKMERISIKGPRGKVPTIAEIERAMVRFGLPPYFKRHAEKCYRKHRSLHRSLASPWPTLWPYRVATIRC